MMRPKPVIPSPLQEFGDDGFAIATKFWRLTLFIPPRCHIFEVNFSEPLLGHSRDPGFSGTPTAQQTRHATNVGIFGLMKSTFPVSVWL
jgi:hypothetical protein